MKSLFEKFQVPNVLKQFLAAAVSGWMTITAGFAFGFSAVLLPELKKDKDFPYEPYMGSWIASISPLSMVIGCLGAGSLIDHVGRRSGHIVLGVISLISWILIAFATNNTYMLIGRFISGLSVGANRPVSLVYIGEITDPKYRSLTLVGPSINLALGIITCHLLGGYVSWRNSCFIYGAVNISSLMLLFCLKESPLWLISKGRIDEGVEAFKWFRGEGMDSEKELQSVLLRQNGTSQRYFLKDIFCMSFIKPMSVVFLLSFVHFNGANVFNFYAQDMIKSTFKGSIDPFLFMIGLDFVRLTVIVLVFAFNKFIPRKISLITLNFGCAISLFMLAAYLVYMKSFGSIVLSITITILYITFGGGVVTLGWAFVPELFPANLRGLGSGIGSAMSFFILFICVKISPGFMAMYGTAAMYGTFGVITIVTNIILCFVLPETSGRTLQEIEDSFKKSTTVI